MRRLRRRPLVPNGAGDQCQACTATRVAPRSAASSNANSRVALASYGWRTPTATSRCTALVSSLTTTTGQEACMAAYLLTEPSSIAANPPAPRAPTTSISAPEPLLVTISAGGPVSRWVSTGKSGATSLTRVMASPSARRGTLPSTLATPGGAVSYAHMRGGIAGADTIRSGASCRSASRAAHSTARSDSSEPSTPTTTGGVAMTHRQASRQHRTGLPNRRLHRPAHRRLLRPHPHHRHRTRHHNPAARHRRHQHRRPPRHDQPRLRTARLTGGVRDESPDIG